MDMSWIRSSTVFDAGSQRRRISTDPDKRSASSRLSSLPAEWLGSAAGAVDLTWAFMWCASPFSRESSFVRSARVADAGDEGHEFAPW